MRVFVTGGSGFVGRKLIETLRARGHTVRALARSQASMEVVAVAGAEPCPGDLDDLSKLTDGMRGCDAVIHAAASTQEWGRYADFYRANVAGTENVLAAARVAGVPRAVHVSTEAVLLDGAPLVQVDETRPIPAQVIGLYPSTKALAEQRALAANRDGLEVVVVRPRFVWGKGDTSLLPKIVEAVKAGRFAWIGGGRFLTSTCHVANACEALALAMERGRGGEVYFATDGAPVELRGFLSELLRTQGVTPPSREVSFGLARASAAAVEGIWRLLGLRRPPPMQRTAVLLIGQEVTVNDAKARRELGYLGAMSREAGLAELGMK